MSYYWCMGHNAVEGEDGCKAKDRLGPYATEGEAAGALEKVKQRNETWDAQDDWGEGSESDD